jgi:hypothetical protein
MDTRTSRPLFLAILMFAGAIGAFFFLGEPSDPTPREADLERQLQEARAQLEETREKLEQSKKVYTAGQAVLRARQRPLDVPKPAPAEEPIDAKASPGNPSPASGRVLAVTPTDQLCVVSWPADSAPRANQILHVLRGDKVVGKLKLTGSVRRREQAIADIIPDSFPANDFPRPGDRYQMVPE